MKCAVLEQQLGCLRYDVLAIESAGMVQTYAGGFLVGKWLGTRIKAPSIPPTTLGVTSHFKGAVFLHSSRLRERSVWFRLTSPALPRHFGQEAVASSR